MFACHFFTSVSCLNYYNLPYCLILPTSLFSNAYFYISLRLTCLFISFNAVGVNFVSIAYYFYSIAPDEVSSNPRKLVPLIKTKSTLVNNFLFFSD